MSMHLLKIVWYYVLLAISCACMIAIDIYQSPSLIQAQRSYFRMLFLLHLSCILSRLWLRLYMLKVKKCWSQSDGNNRHYKFSACRQPAGLPDLEKTSQSQPRSASDSQNPFPFHTDMLISHAISVYILSTFGGLWQSCFTFYTTWRYISKQIDSWSDR